jgi:hypothetical protein
MYPRFLKEAWRVLVPDGDLFILTLEKQLMRQLLKPSCCGWRLVSVRHVFVGFDVAFLHLKPQPRFKVSNKSKEGTSAEKGRGGQMF